MSADALAAADSVRMMTASDLFTSRLERAQAMHGRRALPPPAAVVDFCSNDYLGLARQGINTLLFSEAAPCGDVRFGSGGSRLLSGNSLEAEALEAEVAVFHRADAALLFNSGYDANLGLFSALPRDSCQIFYDDRSHASVKDGIVLSRAWAQPFRHNDLSHLERRLRHVKKTPFVAVESLYSMDGDQAPLADLVTLCERYGANLVVDEAHAVGVYGDGAGLVPAAGLSQRVFARVITYGKAFGCHGAAVLGSPLLRDYLVNFCHAFIYTTALPRLSLAAVRIAYRCLQTTPARRHLQDNISYFRGELQRRGCGDRFLPSSSPIQGLLLPLRDLAAASNLLARSGYDVKTIRSPTVRRGCERLRICLHSFNTAAEIAGLLEVLTGGRWL